MASNTPRSFWGPRYIQRRAVPNTTQPPTGEELTPPTGKIILTDGVYVLTENNYILVEDI